MAGKKPKVNTDNNSEVTGYIVRLLNPPKYFHLDPFHGATWGARAGAFQYRTEYDAAQLTPAYTNNAPFVIIPVDAEG